MLGGLDPVSWDEDAKERPGGKGCAGWGTWSSRSAGQANAGWLEKDGISSRGEDRIGDILDAFLRDSLLGGVQSTYGQVAMGEKNDDHQVGMKVGSTTNAEASRTGVLWSKGMK
ncbi:MAG: hypothetical protein Q9192_000781 [Flavoplaca navasiana]